MKEFYIKGKIISNENITHQDMLNKLYKSLNSENLFFKGNTKELNKK